MDNGKSSPATRYHRQAVVISISRVASDVRYHRRHPLQSEDDSNFFTVYLFTKVKIGSVFIYQG